MKTDHRDKNEKGRHVIDLLAILQKSLDRALFDTFLNTRFDRVALELLSLLCTFGNSTKCSKVSFD